MFEIILTTTEYLNGNPTRTESTPYYRRYKVRQTAERHATRMNETVSLKGSPVKYVTVAEVRHV
ncbi:hypothetical protein LWV78_002616 [Salmonella enterica]|uniref:Uncharacterized protein n=1 Tax=Salmonella enterica TaxID=28901 RepID=A0A5V0Q927_SALER|nr:hypothetical protein [Salmonella enterica]ECS6609550.1 hypothetical protein [Salmonella enterica subsp. enterica serovar Give]EDI3196298.1 hypothetical protein [Salmonella enterica subsp. enterica serovar Rubislaw]EDX4384559.1 hypothetical protein [Salmonella enterica subsp. enterica serovar O rough]EED3673274.1 hypothetical protein [Salmonella enterica subsp. enterica serovar Muenchen]EED8611463.1 hypothetical protein [Salmonella enterica subsp. enterica serovar Glostrup]ELJ2722448.1 hypo